MLASMRQPHGRQAFLHPTLWMRVAPQQQRKRHILARGQPGEQVEELKDDADPLTPEPRPVVLRKFPRRASINDDVPFRRPVQSPDQVQQRAFSTAARSHDGQKFPLGHLQGDSLHRPDGRGASLIDLGHSFQTDHAPSRNARSPITYRHKLRQWFDHPRHGGVKAYRHSMADMLDTILHWTFPVDCATYGGPAAERRLPFFCRSCWASIRPIEDPLCPRCGRPFDSPLALAYSPGHLCGPCREKPPRFDRALSPYRYEGVLEQALRLFKYRRRDALATPLADLILVWANRLPPVDLVVPVPLHPRKLRGREFNQSLLLADRIARRLSLPLSFEHLVRTRDTQPQTELDRRDRTRNVRR